jgi:hypothetical protein
MDENAFVVVDISGVKPYALEVKVVERTEG